MLSSTTRVSSQDNDKEPGPVDIYTHTYDQDGIRRDGRGMTYDSISAHLELAHEVDEEQP
jgi:hypothetical protein